MILVTIEYSQNFHQILLRHSNKKKKVWWESYLRNVIPFIGVSIPGNRRLLKDWYKLNHLENLKVEDQLQIVTEFMKGDHAEDKISGVLFMQLFLLEQPNFEIILSNIEKYFDEKYIFDWNTCDWLCVRILTPIIESENENCRKKIISWKDAQYLWKARSSAVGFAQAKNIMNYLSELNEINKILIRRGERFAKTAVGWTLREISKHKQDYVINFIEKNIDYFTKETISNSLKYFPKEVRNLYKNKV